MAYQPLETKSSLYIYMYSFPLSTLILYETKCTRIPSRSSNKKEKTTPSRFSNSKNVFLASVNPYPH